MRLSPGLFLCTSLACLYLAGCSEEKTAIPSAARPVRTIVVEPFKALPLSRKGPDAFVRATSAKWDLRQAAASYRAMSMSAAWSGRVNCSLGSTPSTTRTRSGPPRPILPRAMPRSPRPPRRNSAIASCSKRVSPPAPTYENALRALQSAQAQVQAAEANLRIAQNQLRYTELVAPDDGVVTATKADPGQVVAAGQNVIEISRIAEREAVFDVAAEHAAQCGARHGCQSVAPESARPRGHRFDPRDLARGQQHHRDL